MCWGIWCCHIDHALLESCSWYGSTKLKLILKQLLYPRNIFDFWVLESKFVIFLMSVLKEQVNSFSNFALFLIVMTHNSPVNFKVIPFLLWTKGSHQSPNFDTFKCSGENLPNFSSLFSNHKSVFLQNFHNSSVSWKITPLYFCSSNNIYFYKEPIKTQIF